MRSFYIFSAKNISTLDFRHTRRLNESLTNDFVKLTMLWTTGPRMANSVDPDQSYNNEVILTHWYLIGWYKKYANKKNLQFTQAWHCSSIGSVSAWHASSPEFDPHIWQILSWRFGHEKISTAILPLLLIQEEKLSVTGKRMCTKYWETA